MKNHTEIKKKLTSNWFKFLQLEIVRQFQTIERNYCKENNLRNKKFNRRNWKKEKINEGGGTSYLLTNGNIFEKVGVNQSTVSGKFEKTFRSKIFGAQKNGKYWGSGISVVAHMKNPKIPALHFNTRFISTTKEWFGGGMDATPSFKDKNEKIQIHKKLKKICLINKKNYSKYKKWCDNYFYLPHRKEMRGIGGVFFDYEVKKWKENFKFVRDLGIGFLEITSEIIQKKKDLKWNNRDKELQLYKRGRYIEFNLLYDRGTKFGLNSGGDTEAILMSLPPTAKWK